MFRNGLIRGLASAWMLGAVFHVSAIADPVILDNGQIRIEIDLQFFVVRYVGVPGGDNMVAPMHVPRWQREQQPASITPGGLTYYVYSSDTELTYGPGEIAEQSPLRAVILGPVEPATQARIRLMVALAASEPEATVQITIQTVNQQSHSLGLSSQLDLPYSAQLRLPKPDATIREVSPDLLGASLLNDGGDYWDIDPPVPSGVSVQSGYVDAGVSAMAVQCGSYRWIRRLEAPDGASHNNEALRYQRDHAQRRRIVRWKSSSSEVDLWNQPTVVEVWRMETAGD